ncbi:ribonuclease h [Stemphylium lycopersici]|uniref:ribonuclease H n=1 Tax=Stemphylium lycopersici TaxID=183478 RepID=A0A364N079_STELY|nr:ribonuclease h [Stemphylium lycopersici]RAR08489.1 ribonuclease H-like protein [Stemphylium lycopersici]
MTERARCNRLKGTDLAALTCHHGPLLMLFRHTSPRYHPPASLSVRTPNPPALAPFLSPTATSQEGHPRRRYSTWEDHPDTIVTEEGAMAAALSTTSSSSGKRKHSAANNFWVVKNGKASGIYQSLDDVQRQTEGADKPVVKGFPTHAAAEAFLRGTAAKKTKAAKYYGVAVGRVPGIYTDWPTAKSHIDGVKGARHQSFPTWEEAKAFVDRIKKPLGAPISLRADLSETSSASTGKMDGDAEHAAKRQKTENTSPTMATTSTDIKMEPGMGPLPSDAVDGFDPNIKLDDTYGDIRAKTEDELSATKQQPTGHFNGPIYVDTDGGSRGNGRTGAKAGVGVYFGPNDPRLVCRDPPSSTISDDDPRNVAEPLRGERQTNQRAELVAIARALDHIPIDRSVVIKTDSWYSIRCLKEWNDTWEKRDWKNSAGNNVENQDLIKPILARMRERDACQAETAFTWVKGHNGDPGNVGADAQANKGMEKWTVKLASGSTLDMSPTLRTPYTNRYSEQPKQGRLRQEKPKQEKPKQEKSEADEFGGEDMDEAFNNLPNSGING